MRGASLSPLAFSPTGDRDALKRLVVARDDTLQKLAALKAKATKAETRSRPKQVSPKKGKRGPARKTGSKRDVAGLRMVWDRIEESIKSLISGMMSEPQRLCAFTSR